MNKFEQLAHDELQSVVRRMKHHYPNIKYMLFGSMYCGGYESKGQQWFNDFNEDILYVVYDDGTVFDSRKVTEDEYYEFLDGNDEKTGFNDVIESHDEDFEVLFKEDYPEYHQEQSFDIWYSRDKGDFIGSEWEQSIEDFLKDK